MTFTRAREDGFRFEYDPAVLRYGVGSAADLGAELASHGLDRALVVCGSTVGESEAVMDPVRRGLGDRLAGVFGETTPAKRLSTAVRAREAMREVDADVIVGLGGGSSLDVATVTSVLAAADRDPKTVAAELASTGSIAVPDGPLPPVLAVPTTLAGADCSQVAGVSASPEDGLVEEEVSGSVSDPRLVPLAVVADPALFATTPRSVLVGSAMNGFDKGIETCYAANATPITDATAVRGLRLMADGLERLGDEGVDADVLRPVVKGLLLVEYGVSRPDGTTLSVVHAFGHGVRRGYDVQQGDAHAVLVPHVLRDLFDAVDGRRSLLAEALVADNAGGDPAAGDSATAESATGDPADAIVDRVTDVRDALGLPTRLRDLDGPTPEEFPEVAAAVLDDRLMANAPPGYAPSQSDVEAVLRAAW